MYVVDKEKACIITVCLFLQNVETGWYKLRGTM